MKNSVLFKVGDWFYHHPGRVLRKNRLLKDSEAFWNMKIGYYVDKLGEDYPCEETDLSPDKVKETRSKWVHIEKCEITGGFLMGSLCAMLWGAGDYINKYETFTTWSQIVIRIAIYLCVVMMTGAATAFLLQSRLNKRVRKRQETIKGELPGFVTNMILLLQAGVTVVRAFNMSVEAIKTDSPLRRAGTKVEKDILRGMREEEALEKFADRCRIIEASRLVSVMIQNLRKGGTEISPMLRVVANECWEERKKIARVKGEEASAKLLLPMMMLLLAIICVVVTPAMLTLMEV